MRGLVGGAVIVTMLGWFSMQTGELVGRMQDRVQVLQSAATVREAALDLDQPDLLATGDPGHTRWKELFSRGEDLPSGVKQQALWKEQTRKLLAGEPPTPSEERLVASAERRVRRP